MCKKYPFVAMLLVGSASHSLVASAVTSSAVPSSTATMRFEGTIEPICSAVVMGGTQRTKSIHFGGDGVDSAKHVYELQVQGNSPASVRLALASVNPSTALKLIEAVGTRLYTPKIMSRNGTGNAYTEATEYTSLNRGEKVSVYLDAEGRGKALFSPGGYNYEVIATIACS